MKIYNYLANYFSIESFNRLIGYFMGRSVTTATTFMEAQQTLRLSTSSDLENEVPGSLYSSLRSSLSKSHESVSSSSDFDQNKSLSASSDLEAPQDLFAIKPIPVRLSTSGDLKNELNVSGNSSLRSSLPKSHESVSSLSNFDQNKSLSASSDLEAPQDLFDPQNRLFGIDQGATVSLLSSNPSKHFPVIIPISERSITSVPFLPQVTQGIDAGNRSDDLSKSGIFDDDDSNDSFDDKDDSASAYHLTSEAQSELMELIEQERQRSQAKKHQAQPSWSSSSSSSSSSSARPIPVEKGRGKKAASKKQADVSCSSKEAVKYTIKDPKDCLMNGMLSDKAVQNIRNEMQLGPNHILDVEGIKQLGKGYYRKRVGDIRIIYKVDDAKNIWIKGVCYRKNAYTDLNRFK